MFREMTVALNKTFWLIAPHFALLKTFLSYTRQLVDADVRVFTKWIDNSVPDYTLEKKSRCFSQLFCQYASHLLYITCNLKKNSISGWYFRTDASSLLLDYISQGPTALWCIWSGSVARNEIPDFHDTTFIASTSRKWRLHPLSTLQNQAVK